LNVGLGQGWSPDEMEATGASSFPVPRYAVHCCCVGIAVSHAIGVIALESGIIFFEGDREGEIFAF